MFPSTLSKKTYKRKVKPERFQFLDRLIKKEFYHSEHSLAAARIVIPHKLVTDNLDYSINHGPKDATDTVKQGFGDCEDHSVLLSSMYKAVGLQPMILRFSDPDQLIGGQGHLSTLIKAPRARETIENVREYYYEVFDEFRSTISIDQRNGDLWLVSGSTMTNYVGDISTLESNGHVTRQDSERWEWNKLSWTVKP